VPLRCHGFVESVSVEGFELAGPTVSRSVQNDIFHLTSLGYATGLSSVIIPAPPPRCASPVLEVFRSSRPAEDARPGAKGASRPRLLQAAQGIPWDHRSGSHSRDYRGQPPMRASRNGWPPPCNPPALTGAFTASPKSPGPPLLRSAMEVCCRRGPKAGIQVPARSHRAGPLVQRYGPGRIQAQAAAEPSQWVQARNGWALHPQSPSPPRAVFFLRPALNRLWARAHRGRPKCPRHGSEPHVTPVP
jgi:hypothetical protein